MKHLVKVTAEFEFVVLVDDEEDEHQVCEDFVADALRDMSPSGVRFQTEAYTDGGLHDWDGDLEPYNGSGKSTDEWAALLPDNAGVDRCGASVPSVELNRIFTGEEHGTSKSTRQQRPAGDRSS